MAGPYHTPSGANKKVGSRPLIRSTRFRANLEYIPAARQKQDKGTLQPIDDKLLTRIALLEQGGGRLDCLLKMEVLVVKGITAIHTAPQG